MRRSGLATLVVTLVLLVGCTGVPDGIEPVSPFAINRYQGTWYDIIRLDHTFERGLSNVTAIYDLRDDCTVGVVNRGFDHEKCRWSEAEGIARFRGQTSEASLSVTFFWPFAGGYHCLRSTKKTTATLSLPARRATISGFWPDGPISRSKSGTTL